MIIRSFFCYIMCNIRSFFCIFELRNNLDGMYRNLINQLVEWKNSDERKPRKEEGRKSLKWQSSGSLMQG